CGSKLGYLKATVEFALRHPEVAKDFNAYLSVLMSTLHLCIFDLRRKCFVRRVSEQ
ncbi:MAG: UTP--glucose-1-phosphate uridylyltransferase (EC, partial [uncultured Caballeronia sp.]